MTPAAFLAALDTPAALFDGAGARVAANPLWLASPDQPAPGDAAHAEWSVSPVEGGLTLVRAADPRLLARARMLATLSHEVRTPLNGVLGMAGLLSRTPLDPTQAAYLASLRECGEHLLGLVEEVLDFARLDAGRIVLEPAPTDVERLLQGVCELLSPRAHAAGVELAWAVEEGPAPVLVADDGRLRQILFNLAGNAVKLVKRGGVLVSARVRRDGQGRVRLRLSVRDTGPGLDAASQSRIFGEFEQAEAGVQAGGAGLGLAIVRRLTEAFGGALGIDSRPGEGACFWFEASFDTAADPAQAAAPALGGLRIGVCSPSAVVEAAAALMIEAEGGAAWRLDDDADPAATDLVLVDAGAGPPPPPPQGVPALILIAPEARDGIAAAREAGYAGYLVKPLRRASLVTRIDAALGRAPASPGPARSAPAWDDERAAPAAASGARVLLAEDNPVNALLARALLVREGCAVDRAASGEEAVAAALACGYDLILMDVRMPGVDGLTAAARLRAAGVVSPIVALTANAFEDDRRACLEAGMDDFLTKPLDAAALRAVLARWTVKRAA